LDAFGEKRGERADDVAFSEKEKEKKEKKETYP